MRRTIAMRKRFRAFGCGALEMLQSDNPKILTFIRSLEEEQLLDIINLSRFSQSVSIDLSRYSGMIPEELFSFISGRYFSQCAAWCKETSKH